VFFPDIGDVIDTNFIWTYHLKRRDKWSRRLQKFEHSFCCTDADWTIGGFDHQEYGKWKLLLLRGLGWTCWRRRFRIDKQWWNQDKTYLKIKQRIH
jgi:hypothetical protein